MTMPPSTVSGRWITGAPALALLLMVGVQLSAADLIYPADAGISNVRSFGARGDGVTDDTAALQAAYNGTGLIYLPNGTYLVSGQILAPPRSGSAPSRRVLVGQSRDGVVIRLKDACAGFTDPAVPRSILRVSYGVAQAFRNSVRNLTIDVGSGNPGAVALEFFASNQGAIDGVALRTADAQRRGHTGLLLTGDNGPLLVKDLTVTGFDIGIKANANATATFRRITLAEQRTVGIDAPNRLFVHGLTSRNAVPALRTSAAISVLIDADLTGGSPSLAAIEVTAGVSFMRSIRTSGYQRALAATGAPDTATIGEWTSAPPVVVTGARQTSLQLPLEDPPAIPWDDPGAWANAAADPDAAHGLAFQAALDSGAATVYFPRTRTTYLTGTFTISAVQPGVRGGRRHRRGSRHESRRAGAASGAPAAGRPHQQRRPGLDLRHEDREEPHEGVVDRGRFLRSLRLPVAWRLRPRRPRLEPGGGRASDGGEATPTSDPIQLPERI